MTLAQAIICLGGKNVSGGYTGKLCGIHNVKSGHEFLNQGTFDSFFGSLKGLIEMMSIFHKLTSSPLLPK